MKRFWDKVDKSGDCWEWTGLKTPYGYGRIHVDGETILAHRLVMGLPEGKLVCHHCDNPSCVNPDHLYIGTHADNNRDRAERNPRTGEKHPMAKLTTGQVDIIREWNEYPWMTQKNLAATFKIAQSQVSRIVNHTRW